MSTTRELGAVMVMWGLALGLSAVAPTDALTWLFEVLPVLIAAPLMWVTRTRFTLTRVLLWTAFVHGLILIIGGHYTYAEVPIGFWLQDAFDFSRNHYDRIGHVAQGFGPALLTREVLLRFTPLKPGKLVFAIAVCMPLAFSAFYEMIEWWTAIILDENATAFLGTQGDPWDTQADMLMALLGAIIGQLVLGRLQSKQLRSLGQT